MSSFPAIERVSYLADHLGMFGFFRCIFCRETTSPGSFVRHLQDCPEPQPPRLELVLGPKAVGEIEEWAAKHGSEEPHFSMKISLRDLKNLNPDIFEKK